MLIERRFDVADRPVATIVRDGAALDAQVEAIAYGDADADRAAARAANRLGRAVRVRDGAGEVRTVAYDPAGAVRTTERQLRVDLDDTPDWRGAVALEAEVLTAAARTDALGRGVWTRLADGTERRDAVTDQRHRDDGGRRACLAGVAPDDPLSRACA